MALQEDQRAMLQLLLEREQSYGDLASLLGVDEDGVRTRAREALTEIAGTDPDHEVALSDYLLGQADPIGRADAARHLKEDADDYALAEKLIAQLRLIAPGAELPKLPSAPKRSRIAPRREKPKTAAAAGADAKEKPPVRRTPRLPRIRRPGRLSPSSLTPTQARLFVAVGAGAVILIAVVLAVAGVFEGGEDAPSEPAATAGSDTEVPIALRPTRGTDARGDAVFGVLPEGSFYLDLRLRKLPQLPSGKAYVMWFLATEEAGYPVPAPLEPDKNGTFNDRLSLPAETLAVAEQAQFFDISVVDLKELGRSIEASVEQDGAALAYPGGSVLRGRLTARAADAGGGGAQIPGG